MPSLQTIRIPNSPESCENKSKISLRFVHKWDGWDDEKNERSTARDAQKVKIVSVKVCTMAMGKVDDIVLDLI